DRDIRWVQRLGEVGESDPVAERLTEGGPGDRQRSRVEQRDHRKDDDRPDRGSGQQPRAAALPDRRMIHARTSFQRVWMVSTACSGLFVPCSISASSSFKMVISSGAWGTVGHDMEFSTTCAATG